MTGGGDSLSLLNIYLHNCRPAGVTPPSAERQLRKMEAEQRKKEAEQRKKEAEQRKKEAEQRKKEAE
ncbi:hypothetical protein EYF80_067606 [Liparis tanakae]|uniref:Uncharacterized protein n=1 Tax=Liparis tanakae TaxID=230148 RepID=A0A4Z2E0M0_9TELE|nr:hypothetical protein EYF80_067606 [Liparis tanakae]